MLNRLLSTFADSGVGQWYFAQTPRDQRATLGIVAVLSIALLYVLVWSPIAEWRTLSQQRYENAIELKTFMETNKERARQAVNNGGGGGRSLLAVVGGVARSHQLILSRFQPESRGGVSVVMQNAEFNAVMAFLAELEEQHGLHVRQLSLDKQAPGRVSARLVVF